MSLTAIKDDNGKERYSDMPLDVLKEVSKAFTYGGNKYGKYNYSKGMEWSRYYDAAMRHLNSFMTGEDIDESGNHHLSHAIASLMMLQHSVINAVGVDDRNPTYLKNNKRRE